MATKYRIVYTKHTLSRFKKLIMTVWLRRVIRSSQFVIIKLTFTIGGDHNLLWSEATTFWMSQGAYLRHETTTDRCGQGPQHLKSHRTGTI